MNSLRSMYPGKAYSPQTTIAEPINATATEIVLTDASVLPDAPNIAVIGISENAETILYKSKNGNILSGVVRSVARPNEARAWNTGTVIARNITSLDLDTIQESMRQLHSETESGFEALEDNLDKLAEALREEIKEEAENAALDLEQHADLDLWSDQLPHGLRAQTSADSSGNTRLSIHLTPTHPDSLSPTQVMGALDNIDSLNSTRTDATLSANQGRILSERFETGLWTPTTTLPNTLITTPEPTANRFVRVGNQVTVSMALRMQRQANVAQALVISGLPFAPLSNTHFAMPIRITNDAGTELTRLMLVQNGTNISFTALATVALLNQNNSAFNGTGAAAACRIFATFTYIIA